MSGKERNKIGRGRKREENYESKNVDQGRREIEHEPKKYTYQEHTALRERYGSVYDKMERTLKQVKQNRENVGDGERYGEGRVIRDDQGNKQSNDVKKGSL